MRRLGRGLLYAIVGGGVAALAGYILLLQLSTNAHDRELEATMTAVFVCAPAGAVLGFLLGLLRGGARTAPPAPNPRAGEPARDGPKRPDPSC